MKRNILFIAVLLISLNLFSQNKYIKTCLSAVEFEKKGDYTSAIAKYNEAIIMKPQKWQPYFYRAKVYKHTNRNFDAISDLTIVLGIDNKNIEALKIRAQLYFAINEYSKAIDDYSKIINEGKEKYQFSYYYNRGISKFHLKNFNDAAIDFSSAISKTTNDNDLILCYNWRAKAFYEAENFSDAVKDFELYFSKNKDTDLEALFLCGLSNYKLGNKSKAMEIAEKISKEDPTKQIFSGEKLLNIFNLEYRRNKTNLFLKQADEYLLDYKNIPSKSLADLKIIDAFESLDSAWLYSSTITEKDRIVRDTIKAKLLSSYSRISEKPAIKEITRKYIVQAEKATEEKRYIDAIELWNKTHRISPYLPIIHFNRALLYEVRGAYNYAIEDMKMYLKLSPEAKNVRTAKDKIYEWEGKISNNTSNNANTSNNYSAINTILENNINMYHFSMAFGGSIGLLSVGSENFIDNFWETSLLPTESSYPDMHFSGSGDIEAILRPIKYIGIGGYFKTIGGLGYSDYASSTLHNLVMATNETGFMARLYLVSKYRNMYAPDVFFSYKRGNTSLNGRYSVSVKSIINYSKKLYGTFPSQSIGFGFGGKVSKHMFLSMSLDYLTIDYDKVKYKVTINDANPLGIGETGTYNDFAKSNGLTLNLLLGFCF